MNLDMKKGVGAKSRRRQAVTVGRPRSEQLGGWRKRRRTDQGAGAKSRQSLAVHLCGLVRSCLCWGHPHCAALGVEGRGVRRQHQTILPLQALAAAG